MLLFIKLVGRIVAWIDRRPFERANRDSIEIFNTKIDRVMELGDNILVVLLILTRISK